MRSIAGTAIHQPVHRLVRVPPLPDCSSSWSTPPQSRGVSTGTEALSALLLRRIAARVPGIGVPETRDGTSDLLNQAEELCPERDYSTCVNDLLSHASTGSPVMLCVSPIGQWTLIPLVAPGQPVPCPDDWTVAGLLPRERSS